MSISERLVMACTLGALVSVPACVDTPGQSPDAGSNSSRDAAADVGRDAAVDAADALTDRGSTQVDVSVGIDRPEVRDVRESDDAPDVVGVADVADVGPPPIRARPIAPLSTSAVTSQRPTLRWVLPEGADGATVELCRDRACDRDRRTINVTGAATRPEAALDAGWWFWRVQARNGAVAVGEMSPTWQFLVGRRDAAVDGSAGAHLDVNGDGFVDIAVGTSPDRENLTISVFLGGAAGLSTTPASTLTGRSGRGEFGTLVSPGDLNGDGFGDLVFQDTIARTEDLSEGRVRVYFGSASGLVAAPVVLVDADHPDAGMGSSLAGVGDVDGDGYADLAVGEMGYSRTVESNEGRVLVFAGGLRGPGRSPAFTIEGAADSYFFGTNVAGGSDMDGDGHAELIVGAYGISRGGARRSGTVSVFRGDGARFAAVPVVTLTSDEMDASFGTTLALGDVNGDGLADLAVGSPASSFGDVIYAGRVRVYAGSASGLAAMPARVIDGTDHGGLGTAMSMGGDLNGDGFADLAIGAPNGRSAEREMGTVTVYAGGAAGVSAAPTWTFLGAGNRFFGQSLVINVGSNGDGIADLIVGDPIGNAVSVFVGGTAGPMAAPTRVIMGPTEPPLFGFLLATH